jgi:hypothetical protein
MSIMCAGTKSKRGGSSPRSAGERRQSGVCIKNFVCQRLQSHVCLSSFDFAGRLSSSRSLLSQRTKEVHQAFGCPGLGLSCLSFPLRSCPLARILRHDAPAGHGRPSLLQLRSVVVATRPLSTAEKGKAARRCAKPQQRFRRLRACVSGDHRTGAPVCRWVLRHMPKGSGAAMR